MERRARTCTKVLRLPASDSQRLDFVLSIGKLATGQAHYYLQQVECRIDRVTSVASGVEDYYLGEGEAAGEWIGTGPLALGAARHS